MKIVLLNGPPRCGKDAIAKHLEKNYGARLFRFASPVKEALKTLFRYTDQELEEAKVLHPEIRNAHIYLAESVAKPIYGAGYFGSVCAQAVLQNKPAFAVVPDLGFQTEGLVFSEALPNALIEVWQIDRPGCTFKNDSRGWVYAESRRMRTIWIPNRGSLEDLLKAAERQASMFLEAEIGG